jgi:anaerobic magnesium-protoporphyrin IX monomethyl ester cyclase
MKILLVQPPIEDFYDTPIRTYPLGLLYIAAALNGVAEVALLDARTGRRRMLRDHPFPELERFYGDSVSTPFSFFGRYRRYGMTRDEMKDVMMRESPDVIGIASMCSAFEKQALEVAETAKSMSRQIITIIGGTHPTLFPRQVLQNPCVDYCVRGEGETPLRRLLSALGKGARVDLAEIEGLCFRKGNTFHLSRPNAETDIDRLPNRRLLAVESYLIGKKPYAFFLTSRGCPLACAFCGRPPVPYRKRSLAGIEREIEDCRSLGIEALDFEDDMLNLDRRFFADVLTLLDGQSLTLSAMNGIYPDAMDVPTLERMYHAGFRRLNFSLVDISDQVLKRQERKQHQPFQGLLHYLEGAPFLVEAHFIIGLPGQKPSHLLDTLLFLMERRILLGPSIFYLSPGSPLCPTGEWGDPRIPFETMRSSFMAPFNPFFPRSVTFTFVKLVRFINYVKQVVDRCDSITRASDLLDNSSICGNEESRTILTRLLHDKRLVYYDTTVKSLVDEPVDQSLIKSFLDRAKGKKIKGYRSNSAILVDI